MDDIILEGAPCDLFGGWVAGVSLAHRLRDDLMKRTGLSDGEIRVVLNKGVLILLWGDYVTGFRFEVIPGGMVAFSFHDDHSQVLINGGWNSDLSAEIPAFVWGALADCPSIPASREPDWTEKKQ